MNYPMIFPAKTPDLGAVANMQTSPEQRLATEGCFTRFAVNRVYSTRSICDHDCIFRWLVFRRTAKSVWVRPVRLNADGSYTLTGNPVRRSIGKDYDGTAEMIYPSGKFSMCPVLTAHDVEN